MKMSWKLFVITLFMVAGSRADLIIDGGFEGGGTYPGEWRYVASTDVATYIKTGVAGEDVNLGIAAISISNPVETDERWYLRNAGAPSITEGVEYELALWVKAESMDLAQTYISLVWLNDSYSPVGSAVNSSSISENIDWTQISVVGTAPVGAAYLRPTLVVKALDAGSDATVTFDDYQVTSIPEPGTLGLFSVAGMISLGLRRLVCR